MYVTAARAGGKTVIKTLATTLGSII